MAEDTRRVTVWITKYALTRGIIKTTAELLPEFKAARAQVGNYQVFVYKPDWWLSEAEARDHAEKMRIKRISSLHKQIAQLTSMQIQVVVES